MAMVKLPYGIKIRAKNTLYKNEIPDDLLTAKAKKLIEDYEKKLKETEKQRAIDEKADAKKTLEKKKAKEKREIEEKEKAEKKAVDDIETEKKRVLKEAGKKDGDNKNTGSDNKATDTGSGAPGGSTNK